MFHHSVVSGMEVYYTFIISTVAKSKYYFYSFTYSITKFGLK